MANNQKIKTFLMFSGNAEEALNFYMSLFPESKIVSMKRYGKNEGGAEGHHSASPVFPERSAFHVHRQSRQA
jgi:predicted 3-demethylubiquinone-9 3-methyltransferase (glyoxalase superfamily)